MSVLVIDVGGTHVKLASSTAADRRRFTSGLGLTPDFLVSLVGDATRDWQYDVISLGLPGPIAARELRTEPGNLGEGWVGYDFERAFRKPVRVVNDAVMQALGAYDGGRMLFLGLGTGLGSALVSEHVVVPLELGNLPFGDGERISRRVGRQALKSRGLEQWRRDVTEVTAVLRKAFLADYIVLGGGNAKHVRPLPEGTRRGGNEDAIEGGFRLWEELVEPHDREPEAVWRVIE
jgi:polyphosphate glucokinase